MQIVMITKKLYHGQIPFLDRFLTSKGKGFGIYSVIIKHMALIAADIRGRHKQMNTNKNLYNRATTSSNDVTND